VGGAVVPGAVVPDGVGFGLVRCAPGDVTAMPRTAVETSGTGAPKAGALEAAAAPGGAAAGAALAHAVTAAIAARQAIPARARRNTPGRCIGPMVAMLAPQAPRHPAVSTAPRSSGRLPFAAGTRMLTVVPYCAAAQPPASAGLGHWLSYSS
jgi:hypothetical protein